MNPKFKDKDIQEIQNYNYYIQELLTRLSAKTVRDIINVLKSILKYYEDEYNCILQVKRINLPKLEKTRIKILSQKEKVKLEKYCIEENTLKNIKNFGINC